MQHIGIRDVSIFSIISRACFPCISVYFDQKLLKMMDIFFHPVTCLDLTFLCCWLPFLCSLPKHLGFKNRSIPDSDVAHFITVR